MQVFDKQGNLIIEEQVYPVRNEEPRYISDALIKFIEKPCSICPNCGGKMKPQQLSNGETGLKLVCENCMHWCYL